jgi:uncharacterized phage protein (TIGR01671 family)
MREYKFRGKWIRNKHWVYGYVAKHLDSTITIYDGISDSIVDPKTVGQFTGLLDKNGKEIYEGDIIQVDEYDGKGNWIIEWSDCAWQRTQIETYNGIQPNMYSLEEGLSNPKIIGNIHENPGLLEENNDKFYHKWQKRMY